MVLRSALRVKQNRPQEKLPVHQPICYGEFSPCGDRLPARADTMHTPLFMIATGLASYLIGAIPFGFLIARLRGVDIRAVGSRNIGATNVFRSVGKGWGIATFLLDMGKGWCGAVVVPALAARLLGGTLGERAAEWRLLGGVCAVAGHTWPVYLGFRGGKGVATSAGMLLGVAPAAVALALAGWLAALLVSRTVSLASILAAVVLGLAIWFPPFRPAHGWLPPLVLTLLAGLVIARHRANIRRLRAGTEPRLAFGRRAPSPETPPT
jgi:glycerol-3-phosphate acyltransferase PlsY